MEEETDAVPARFDSEFLDRCIARLKLLRSWCRWLAEDFIEERIGVGLAFQERLGRIKIFRKIDDG